MSSEQAERGDDDLTDMQTAIYDNLSLLPECEVLYGRFLYSKMNLVEHAYRGPMKMTTTTTTTKTKTSVAVKNNDQTIYMIGLHYSGYTFRHDDFCDVQPMSLAAEKEAASKALIPVQCSSSARRLRVVGVFLGYAFMSKRAFSRASVVNLVIIFLNRDYMHHCLANNSVDSTELYDVDQQPNVLFYWLDFATIGKFYTFLSRTEIQINVPPQDEDESLIDPADDGWVEFTTIENQALTLECDELHQLAHLVKNAVNYYLINPAPPHITIMKNPKPVYQINAFMVETILRLWLQTLKRKLTGDAVMLFNSESDIDLSIDYKIWFLFIFTLFQSSHTYPELNLMVQIVNYFKTNDVFSATSPFVDRELWHHQSRGRVQPAGLDILKYSPITYRVLNNNSERVVVDREFFSIFNALSVALYRNGIGRGLPNMQRVFFENYSKVDSFLTRCGEMITTVAANNRNFIRGSQIFSSTKLNRLAHEAMATIPLCRFNEVNEEFLQWTTDRSTILRKEFGEVKILEELLAPIVVYIASICDGEDDVVVDWSAPIMDGANNRVFLKLYGNTLLLYSKCDISTGGTGRTCYEMRNLGNKLADLTMRGRPVPQFGENRRLNATRNYRLPGDSDFVPRVSIAIIANSSAELLPGKLTESEILKRVTTNVDTTARKQSPFIPIVAHNTSTVYDLRSTDKCHLKSIFLIYAGTHTLPIISVPITTQNSMSFYTAAIADAYSIRSRICCDISAVLAQLFANGKAIEFINPEMHCSTIVFDMDFKLNIDDDGNVTYEDGTCFKRRKFLADVMDITNRVFKRLLNINKRDLTHYLFESYEPDVNSDDKLKRPSYEDFYAAYPAVKTYMLQSEEDIERLPDPVVKLAQTTTTSYGGDNDFGVSDMYEMYQFEMDEYDEWCDDRDLGHDDAPLTTDGRKNAQIKIGYHHHVVLPCGIVFTVNACKDISKIMENCRYVQRSTLGNVSVGTLYDPVIYNPNNGHGLRLPFQTKFGGNRQLRLIAGAQCVDGNLMSYFDVPYQISAGLNTHAVRLTCPLERMFVHGYVDDVMYGIVYTSFANVYGIADSEYALSMSRESGERLYETKCLSDVLEMMKMINSMCGMFVTYNDKERLYLLDNVRFLWHKYVYGKASLKRFLKSRVGYGGAMFKEAFVKSLCATLGFQLSVDKSEILIFDGKRSYLPMCPMRPHRNHQAMNHCAAKLTMGKGTVRFTMKVHCFKSSCGGKWHHLNNVSIPLIDLYVLPLQKMRLVMFLKNKDLFNKETAVTYVEMKGTVELNRVDDDDDDDDNNDDDYNADTDNDDDDDDERDVEIKRGNGYRFKYSPIPVRARDMRDSTIKYMDMFEDWTADKIDLLYAPGSTCTLRKIIFFNGFERVTRQMFICQRVDETIALMYKGQIFYARSVHIVMSYALHVGVVNQLQYAQFQRS